MLTDVLRLDPAEGRDEIHHSGQRDLYADESCVWVVRFADASGDFLRNTFATIIVSLTERRIVEPPQFCKERYASGI
jgi:hypothetical protein